MPAHFAACHFAEEVGEMARGTLAACIRHDHAMDTLVNVENLVKHYPIRKGVVPRTVGLVRAVDGISFSIARGQTLGLVGESGCGKTTVGRTILRLIEPTSGQVTFDGHDVFSLDAETKCAGSAARCRSSFKTRMGRSTRE